MIPVEGCKGLFRDEESGAIINCNTSEYGEYIKIENRILQEKNEIKRVKEEVEELKSLVSQLLNR